MWHKNLAMPVLQQASMQRAMSEAENCSMGMVGKSPAADIAAVRALHRPCSRRRHSSASRHNLAALPATRWRAS